MASMFISPGDAVQQTALDYYESGILDALSGASALTSLQWSDLKLEIQNSTELFDDEKTYLLSLFPVSGSADVQLTEYGQSDFKRWYISHIVVISIVQWLLILMLFIKLSKSN